MYVFYSRNPKLFSMYIPGVTLVVTHHTFLKVNVNVELMHFSSKCA